MSLHPLSLVQALALGALCLMIVGVFAAALIEHYFAEKRRHIKRVIRIAQGEE